MFKLESYIAPLLMSYINKYVKLQQEDFTLSLWGGDAVLNKLDLRLDAIESALNLPITFKSGHIYELRIHVPWTKLGSEPVVITINTIECILKLRDSASDDNDSSSVRSAESAVSKSGKPRPKRQETEDLPPGYLQSLVNRIVNNVNIVINNLILKFVEDDIVLSVNVKSAECYSVNQDWKRAFVELAMPELVLRRVFDFNDLTVCLDRRNASGKIETYQDPLLYRCSLTCRIHMLYDSLHAKLPSVTRFNLLCERLDLSLTDTQVPLFFRLMELCIALYYGTLEIPGGGSPEDGESKQKNGDSDKDAATVDEEESQSWTSWAWSYVPQILPAEDEDEDGGYSDLPRRKSQPPVLSIGFYIKNASVVFKLTETVHDGATYAGSARVNFVPCLLWEADGISLEVLIQGLTFFDVQMGVTGTRTMSQGDAICGVSDISGNIRDSCFYKSGSAIEEKAHPLIGYMTGSLFDPGGAENQNERQSFIFDEEKHLAKFTETYSLVKFGAFWMDYLFTMEEKDEKGDGRSSAGSQTLEEEVVKENSTLRFLFGPAQVIVSSSMVQRIHKFVYCMHQHEYEPYSKPQKEVVDELRPPPTEAQQRALEEYLPTRTYHVTWTKPSFWFMANDLPQYDVKKRKVTTARRSKKSKPKNSSAPPAAQALPLPLLVVQAERLDIQLTSAMYPRKLVQLVSKMAAPSSNLLHHCHSHTYIKTFGIQAGMSKREGSGPLAPIQNVVQPWSGAWYRRNLLFPMYWKNSLQPLRESMYELPHATVNITKPQLLLLLHTALTWSNPGPIRSLDNSLMDDVFKHAEVRTSRKHPVLEVSVSGVELRECTASAVWAMTGMLTATQAMVIHIDGGHDHITPLMYGPLETSPVVKSDFFSDKTKKTDTTSQDLITFTVQLPDTPEMPAAPAVCIFDVRSVAVTWDPILYEWMKYVPITKRTATPGANSDNSLKVALDQSAVESSSPLKSQDSKSESTHTLPTEGQTRSRSHTLPHSASKLDVNDDITSDPSGDDENQEVLGAWAARWFPLIKIMELQVEVSSCCLFFPSQHVRLQEVSMDIPHMLLSSYMRGTLPDMLVVCCPQLTLHSAGHKTPTMGRMDIPIRTLEQSVAGEKLPWSVDLSQCSVYTVHTSQQRYYVIHPSSVTATVAVTTKYHPPTSDNITSLGLCIHADMETVMLGCSHEQIQLLYDITMGLVGSVTQMSQTIASQFTTFRKPDATTTTLDLSQILPASTPLKVTPNNHTVSTSSQLEPPVTITATSETTSRETTPVQDLEEVGAVKLSLWLQWTLPRLVLAIYSLDERGRDMRVVTEIEDVTTSIDVQDVYCKVKVKVATLNISHEVKDEVSGVYVAGDHEGLLVSCTDHLSQNVIIMSNKTWTNHGQPTPDVAPDGKPMDKGHGFLTVTFTRALRKNVKKRMKKLAFDGIMEDSSPFNNQSAPVYLNELCVNLQPCDFIANCPVISHVLKVFTWRCHPPSDVTKHPVAKQHDALHQSNTAKSLPVLTADILPLIYINSSNFRLIIPTCEESGITEPESQHVLSHDMSVIHIRALTLTPMADNPLPRVVVDKELYRRAVHAGMTQQPGSDIEDRQYQLDMAGLSLSTGRWCDLAVKKLDEAEDKPTVQHPALEWNNLRQQRMVKQEVRLVPIAMAFDLRIVAAPAIVYTPPAGPLCGHQPLLVCGHSLELNATSDMDFYLSTSQVRLALNIFSTNMAALMGVPMVRRVDRGSRRWDSNEKDSVIIDSGIDSESSTFVSSGNKKPDLEANCQDTSLAEPVKHGTSNIVPFDLLLTAGKISFMTYMYKTINPERESGVKAFCNNQSNNKYDHDMRPYPHSDIESTLTTVDSGIELESHQRSSESQRSFDDQRIYEGLKSFGGEINDDFGGLDSELKPLVSTVPFLFATFSQPHTMLKVTREQQKMELSCYDIILRGAKAGHEFSEDKKMMPDAVDYAVHWIETKPGEANHKTGIPPSLYTLCATDFLIAPTNLSIEIKRPLKVNLSISRIEQCMTYLNDLLPHITEIFLSETGTKKTEAETVRVVSAQVGSSSTLTRVQSIELVTVQMVVSIETLPDVMSPGLQLSVRGVHSHTNIRPKENGALDVVHASLSLKDLLLKTAYGGRLQPLLGPMSVDLSTEATWTPHSGPSSYPAVRCYVDAGFVPVTFGQNHFLCLQLLSEHLQDFIQKLPRQGISKQADAEVKGNPMAFSTKRSFGDLDLQVSVDDLRAGDFEYNTVDMDPDILPQPGEIVFSKDHSEDGATMTWCYNQPRVITYLNITPVPFNLPQQLDARLINEHLKVPCILQYWNPLCRQFLDYATFSISQSEAISVALSDVTPNYDDDIVMSHVWRALILHPKDREEAEDTKDGEGEAEPLVTPMTLAASLRVDSCYCRDLLPVFQLAMSSSLIQITLSTHPQHLGKDLPEKLRPYVLPDVYLHHNNDYLTLSLEESTLAMAALDGRFRRLSLECNTSLSCDVVEFRNLTWRPLVEQVDITSNFILKINTEQTLLKSRTDIGPLSLRLGESAVHTLRAAGEAWKELSPDQGLVVLPHFYLLCNNTMESIRTAQVGTEESVLINSHQIVPYAWRSHKIPQMLQLTLEGFTGLWSDPVNIDIEGTTVCVLESQCRKITVLVKVKQITGIQKQVEICGTLLVASRLTQDLEVKLVASKSSPEKTTDKQTDSIAVLGAEASLPSYVVDLDNVRAIRVKLHGLKAMWSQEIAVTGEKRKDSRLVKVPLTDKGSFIHVWCHVFTDNSLSAAQNIVLFVPLFTVRTHLPAPLIMNVETPRLKKNHREELKGQGHAEQLVMVGGDMTHNITFQLSPMQAPSRPPVALSSGMIEQLTRLTPCVSVSSLVYNWTDDLSETWPYNSIEDMKSPELVKSPLGSPGSPRSTHQEIVMATPSSGDLGNQPNIDLQISLRQRWRGCNTLLIDVAPYWLVVNETDLDLVILENNDQQWRLPRKQTFAPPEFDGPFRLALVMENRLHPSNPVTLSLQEITFGYLQGQQDTLYRQGHLKTAIPVVINKKTTQLCYLTLHSVMSHNMRVVTVRETYVFTNKVGLPLQLQAFSLPLSQHKVSLNHETTTIHDNKSQSSSPDTFPIPLWHQPPGQLEPLDTDTSDVTHVQYISLRRTPDDATKCHGDWAFPCRIRTVEQGVRLGVSVPLPGSKTFPCVLTCHHRAGIVYLVAWRDYHPETEIHNNCGFTIAYGQAISGIQPDDKTIQEEAELTTDVPMLPPGCSAHYSFPACNIHFPEVSTLPEPPRLHLAGFHGDVTGNQKLVWSVGLDLTSEHDMFVNIPDVSDAKVHVEKVGHTLHVFIDPVSRAEISAKEIRSRIKGQERTVVVEGKRQSPDRQSSSETVLDTSVDIKKAEPKPVLRPLLTEVALTCSHASFVLLDEATCSKNITELLRVTSDNMSLLYFPANLYDPFQQMRPHVVYDMTLTCDDLQIDNQMYANSNYDFPVVFLKQSDEALEPPPLKLPLKEHAAKVKQRSLVTIQMLVSYDLLSQSTSLTGMNVAVKPVTIYIEDTFIYDILKKLDRFLTSGLTVRSAPKQQSVTLPRDILMLCYSLSHPVKLDHLTIEPISLLLSVHASLKIFISSDTTPLSFGQFEKRSLFTSSHNLVRAVVMHYASGALFRAGWVVGSLEILGNPTGLVRNIGIGVSDLFRLPYNGLTQGPGAFVGGVTRGMTSLVRHISTGALTSVTNFASSVSRNMDRLSLDSVHRARQEESRRNKPRGLSDGFVNGLTGFGISLLGAVAGIADQPLQTFTGEADSVRSPVRHASGLVSGVGKGLVGAVTKPIGGAAELVSQTGLGLLQGTGLTSFPSPRQQPISEATSTSQSSTLKFIQKLLLTVPEAEVLAITDGVSIQTKGGLTIHQQQVVLLLTHEILFILAAGDDTPLQAYSVSDITCHGGAPNTAKLLVVLNPSTPTTQPDNPWMKHQPAMNNLPEEQMDNKDRVAAFLGGAAGLSHLTEEDLSEGVSARVHSGGSHHVCHEFSVDLRRRNFFLSQFTVAKNKVTGFGFPL